MLVALHVALQEHVRARTSFSGEERRRKEAWCIMHVTRLPSYDNTIVLLQVRRVEATRWWKSANGLCRMVDVVVGRSADFHTTP